MAIEEHKKQNLLQMTTMSLMSLTTSVWDTLGETSFAFGSEMGDQILGMMEKETGLEIAGEDPKDVMTEVSRIFVDDFGLAADIDVETDDNNCFRLKVKQCANYRLSNEILLQAGVDKPFICPVMNACEAALRRIGYRVRKDIEPWAEGSGSIITLTQV